MMSGALRGDNASVLADFGPSSASEVAPVSTMATAMLFGTVTFASAALAARAYICRDLRAVREAQNPRASPLDLRSFTSIYILLYHCTIFGLILLYAYICEYHPPFPHATKSYDRDEFYFLTALLLFASAFTLSKNDKSNRSQTGIENNYEHLSKERAVQEVNEANDVLNRDQTEEWKGWMQYMFLLYHYFHAEEVYNAIRVMITCYVWMTGFGNFSFFYLKGDYSSVRVMQMLWRLNFLVVFLCLSQGTTYILYYICLLHTYFFLMVYVLMRISKHANYTKWGIRVKLGVLAVIIFLVWDVDCGLFRLLHSPFLGETPMLGATSGSMWEWYFRSSLDHWSTFLGMVFALNYPITSLFFRKLEAQPLLWHCLAKFVMGLAIFGIFLVWVLGPFQHGKLEYNATNAYFGFVPLLTYIFFRNLTPLLRSHSLDLLHQIGKTTLETYLMQHHIWLTSDAKSLLVLIPGWPKVNMLVVSIIYYLLSRRLYQLTLFLRGMVLPDDRSSCLRHLAFLVATIAGYYMMAVALRSLGILSLFTVAVVSVVFGMLLYRSIIGATWEKYKESASSNNSLEFSVSEAIVMKAVDHCGGHCSKAVRFPPVIATTTILVIGLFWHGMSKNGASTIKPLPQGCKAFVNQGVWTPVDGCNEESRGVGYRQYGVSSYGTCSAQSNIYVWGWNTTLSSSHCRFVYRDANSLRRALDHRTITFVGDSISRHVYHAMVRAMGKADSGAYNTDLPKHADMNETIGQTTLEFDWAPFTQDLVQKLQNITKRREVGDSVRPDLIVIGGGAWDRLHVYNTDEERDSHHNSVQDLVKEIRRARSQNVPVAWIVPTAINSNALLTEEKRENINEENMKAMRTTYAELGVLDAASFVLDGPAFTLGRVAESYDGVHYPHVVYDAAAQILANAIDWLLSEREISEPFVAPQSGRMANPSLGGIMLAFVFVGLVFSDGFMGFSYLASFIVPCARPADLYEEAYTSLHTRMKLPPIDFSVTGSSSCADVHRQSTRSYKKGNGSGVKIPERKRNRNMDDEEITALIGSTDKQLEITSLE